MGFAVLTYAKQLIEGGLITPAVPKDWSRPRIVSLCDDLRSQLEVSRPTTILVEWPSGKVGKRHHGYGAGLSVYGCGVGGIEAECRHYSKTVHGCEVIPILENDWTRGVPKRDRQLAVASEYPAYRIADDPGADVSDAIGLALWWLKQKRLFS